MPYTPKHLCPAPVTQIAGRQVKPYYITPPGTTVEPSVLSAAEAFLPGLLPAPDEETPPASFVIVHRSRGAGAYLLAYSWIWGNVLECRAAAAGAAFLGCPDEDNTNFVPLDRHLMGCAWELAPLGHERTAWIRHVLAPSQPDLPGYLADVVPEGPTDVLGATPVAVTA